MREPLMRRSSFQQQLASLSSCFPLSILARALQLARVAARRRRDSRRDGGATFSPSPDN